MFDEKSMHFLWLLQFWHHSDMFFSGFLNSVIKFQDWTKIRPRFDRDSTKIGPRLDQDWTEIGPRFNPNWTRGHIWLYIKINSILPERMLFSWKSWQRGFRHFSHQSTGYFEIWYFDIKIPVFKKVILPERIWFSWQSWQRGFRHFSHRSSGGSEI